MRARLLLVLPLALAFTACAQPLEHYRKLGIQQYNAGQYDSALDSLNKALAHGEFDADANTYAGLIHYRAGQYEMASYNFKTALQSDPSSEKAKNGLTAALIRLDKPDMALDYLERASAMAAKVQDPRREKSNDHRIYLHQTEENLYTHKTDDRLRIAKTYEILGDYDNALVYYNKALALDPKNGKILFAIANLFEKTGNAPQCRAYLSQAYLADPRVPGLTDAMTRNNVAISSVLPVPPVAPPLVPANAPAPAGSQ